MFQRRAGFTLIELLVAIVVGGVLGMAIYRTVLAQHATNRHQTAVVASQQVTRAALDVLAAELREVSASGGDIAEAQPNRVEFRAFRKFGVVCSPDAPGQKVDAWVVGQPFIQQDSLIVYAERPASQGGDQWRRMRVQSIGSANCPGWPGMPVQRLNLSAEDGDKLANVRVGAPLRGFSRVTYEIRQIEGEWVLARLGDGATEWVPIIGPLMPPDGAGLVFRYFDAADSELTPGVGLLTAQVARIEISAAASAPGALGAYSDSLRTQVHLRGNAR